MSRRVLDTGIFKHVVGVINSEADAEQARVDWAAQLAADENLESLFARIEKAANSVDDGANLALIIQGGEGEPAGLPAFDAAVVRTFRAQVVNLLKTGKIRLAITTAFKLGRAFQTMQTRHAEAKAVSRQRSDKGLGKGLEKKAGNTASRHKEIADAVKARMDANKKDSLHSARQYVADNSQSILGEIHSFDAIKRATAAVKSRKKMKK